MGALDPTIRLATLLQIEAPGGNVNLCGGGFVDFDAGNGVERFDSHHPVYGTINAVDEVESSFAGQAEGSSISLVPNPEAPITDWYRSDLADSRVRVWTAELAADCKTAENETQLGDYFVDTFSRLIAPDGTQTLELRLIGRDQKLFFINEGNVASERFHKSAWPGEDGFNNCTDANIPVAWGVASPSSGSGRSNGSRPDGSSPFDQVAR